MTETPKSEEIDAEETPQTDAENAAERDEPEPADTTDPDEAPIVDETPADPAPEPAKASAPRLAVPLIIGGALAGAIGFVAGKIDPQATWPFADPSARFEAIEADLGEVAEAQSGLAQSLDQLPDLRNGLGEVTASANSMAGEVTTLSGKLDEISSQMDAFGQRITDLENRPIPDVGATQDAVDAYKRELAAMREMFEAELARIEAAQQDAKDLQVAVVDTGRMAAIRNGLSRLSQDVTAGGSIATGLKQLQSAEVQLPPVLEQNAGDVPGLKALQDSYPDAAREALAEAIRAQATAGEMGRVEAFLKIQLGARSLEPREGSDPDAILARAEAALGAGNVAASLEELASFPDVDTPALDDWTAQAALQAEVMAAAQELEDTLLGGGNE